MLNKKSLFLIIFGAVVLVLGFWAGGGREVKATDYEFLHIKLDTTGGDRDGSCGPTEDCTQLWQFHGFDTLPHDSLNSVTVPADSCAIWLIKENTGFDFGGVVAAPHGQKLSKSGTSVSNDLSGETNLNCADITSGLTCIYAETLAVANFTYGLVDERGDTQDITLSDAVATTYRPDVDILCAGANNWKTCEGTDLNACVIVDGIDWSCNSGVWTKCAATETCASGACVAASGTLVLTASANFLTIGINGTSTITFTVTKNAVPVNGATVENITVTGGGFVDATSCVTAGAGTCAVTYTAPPIAGLYGVNAAKASNGVDPDSGPASIVITVLSPSMATCGPAIGVLCNPVDNASDFYDVIVIAIRYLLSLIALITLLFIVISGIKYLISSGNEEKMRSAKDGLTSAIFGLALVLMAYAVLEVIIRILSS